MEQGLAARLGGQHLFCAVAAAVEAEEDLPFAATLVQALNLLLLTAPEVPPPPPPLIPAST